MWADHRDRDAIREPDDTPERIGEDTASLGDTDREGQGIGEPVRTRPIEDPPGDGSPPTPKVEGGADRHDRGEHENCEERDRAVIPVRLPDAQEDADPEGSER